MLGGLQLRSSDVNAAMAADPLRCHLLDRSWASAVFVLGDLLEGMILANGFEPSARPTPTGTAASLLAWARCEACVPPHPRSTPIRCAALARELYRIQAMRALGVWGLLRYAVDVRVRWVVEVRALAEFARALRAAGLPRQTAVAEATREARRALATPLLRRVLRRGRIDLSVGDITEHVIREAVGGTA